MVRQGGHGDVLRLGGADCGDGRLPPRGGRGLPGHLLCAVGAYGGHDDLLRREVRPDFLKNPPLERQPV